MNHSTIVFVIFDYQATGFN